MKLDSVIDKIIQHKKHPNLRFRLKEKVEKLTKYVENKTIVSSCRISLTLCLTSCVSSFNLPIEVWRLK